jgi:acyl dehydratase
MFTMGSAVNVVTEWVGDAGRVVEYSTRFTKPVVVPYESGADVQVTAVVKAMDAEARRATVELTATCGTDKVLGRAFAVVALD